MARLPPESTRVCQSGQHARPVLSRAAAGIREIHAVRSEGALSQGSGSAFHKFQEVSCRAEGTVGGTLNLRECRSVPGRAAPKRRQRPVQREKRRHDHRQTQPHQAFRGCDCGVRCRNGSPFRACICGCGNATVRQRGTATRQISAKASDDRRDEQAAATGNAVLCLQWEDHHAERRLLRSLPSGRHPAEHRPGHVLGRDQGQGRQALETIAGRHQENARRQYRGGQPVLRQQSRILQSPRRGRANREWRHGQCALEGRAAEGRA